MTRHLLFVLPQTLVFSILLFAEVLGSDVMNCDRKWPSLDIFMPVNVISNRDHEYETIFLRSFLLFFPLKLSNVSLTVAIDIEHSESKQANELKRKFHDIAHRVPGGVKVALLPESEYYRSGYDRQQLVMFWADNFTTSEYVGFVDTDAAFITYVDREDLFEDGKPVVNGGAGYRAIKADGNWKWTVGTFVALGILEPFRCMTYFPVVIKVSHLPEIRDFISRYHNVSFNEAFYNNISSSRNYYSQFAIMCTYLFAFKRDEYKWYVHDITPEWDGKNPPPIFGQDGNISQFTTEMKLPKPRITVHAGYRRCLSNPILDIRKKAEMNLFLQEGVCHSPPFPRTEAVCHDSNRSVVSDGYYHEMHRFECRDFSKVNLHESLINEYQKRYERIKNCSHDWDVKEMEVIMEPADDSTMTD